MLAGCETPPEMEHYEFREFQRPPALIDVAVLDSGVLPNAAVKEYEGGDPIDYTGHGGRRIRVLNDTEKRVTRVLVSHHGFGGPEGARLVLDRIEQWLEDTDHVLDVPARIRGGGPRHHRSPL